jgi:hypothetical protein
LKNSKNKKEKINNKKSVDYLNNRVSFNKKKDVDKMLLLNLVLIAYFSIWKN